MTTGRGKTKCLINLRLVFVKTGLLISMGIVGFLLPEFTSENLQLLTNLVSYGWASKSVSLLTK